MKCIKNGNERCVGEIALLNEKSLCFVEELIVLI